MLKIILVFVFGAIPCFAINCSDLALTNQLSRQITAEQVFLEYLRREGGEVAVQLEGPLKDIVLIGKIQKFSREDLSLVFLSQEPFAGTLTVKPPTSVERISWALERTQERPVDVAELARLFDFSKVPHIASVELITGNKLENVQITNFTEDSVGLQWEGTFLEAMPVLFIQKLGMTVDLAALQHKSYSEVAPSVGLGERSLAHLSGKSVRPARVLSSLSDFQREAIYLYTTLRTMQIELGATDVDLSSVRSIQTFFSRAELETQQYIRSELAGMKIRTLKSFFHKVKQSFPRGWKQVAEIGELYQQAYQIQSSEPLTVAVKKLKNSNW